MTSAAQAETIVATCQRDPEFFVRDVLGDDPWPVQVSILESVRDYPLTAVPSCHSSGKSWIAARAALWFGCSFPGAQVVTTAPTTRQVKGILWKEIASAHRDALYPLGGELTTLGLQFDADWGLLGFTAPDYDPNRFQGFHAPHILVIVDESAGITPAISEQIDSLLSGGHARRLDIGNPVEAGSPFEAACESSAYNVIPISAFDTPNFTEFGITEGDMYDGSWEEKVDGRPMPRPELIGPEWCAQRLAVWGKDSDAWRSRVKGLFPQIVQGSYYGEFMKTAEKEGRVGEYPWDPAVPVSTYWDLGVRDPTAIWFLQQHGDALHLIDYEEHEGQGLPFYAKLLNSKPYDYHRHVAPHDIKNRDFGTGKSRWEAAQELGINFHVLDRLVVKQQSELAEGIDAVRRILPRCKFDAKACDDGIEALKAYKRDKNARTGELKDTPLHNWASHGADSFRYLALGYQPTRKVNRPALPRVRRA